MPTEIETISWYLTDLNVHEGDFLAGMVVTAMAVLEHLEMPKYFSRFSNRIFGDRWKFGLLVLKEYLDVSYEDLVKLLPSFRGVFEAGGAPRIPHKDTLRKCRRTFGQRAINEGQSMHDVSLVMGHSTMATT